ncbi:hypothetical protein F5Y00DRAFT_269229 [Daldinia vernicosa]|uniref:uncharacterized protein n=1 Tax=Daldinia vernicosa TaxID=114800 RepID=UPI00200861BB|nr:uncharacterized protein F5Y00DRAFT_269229 [Daldinia vernicosa]KAI0853854.1 hypothetical protein F5Y00DRAFT_269229 [Daldinia vernicosa]
MEHQHDHERTIEVPVNTQLQESWDNTLKRILSFIQCIDKCNLDSQYHSIHRASAQDYVGDDPKPEWASQLKQTFYSWQQILQSQTPKKIGQFTDEFDEPEPPTKAVYPNHNHKDTAMLSSPTKPKKRKPELLDLPCEVFEHIFEYTVGSYELKGYLLRMCRRTKYRQINSTQLILYKPRAWADLKVLQVCRAFRNLAISYYGFPQENNFPFSPWLDTIVIQGEKLNYLKPSAGVAYYPNLRLQDWNDDDHWLYYDGVYKINEDVCDVKPWSKVTKISNECLRRPTEITMDIYDGTAYKLHWKHIWHFLGRMFTNTTCLRFNISQVDCCALKKLDGFQDQGLEKYLCHDITVFYGLGLAIEESPPNRLFPKLESLKLSRVADYCTGTWSPETRVTRLLLGIKLAYFAGKISSQS